MDSMQQYCIAISDFAILYSMCGWCPIIDNDDSGQSFAYFGNKVPSRQNWHYTYRCLSTGVSRESYRLSGRYKCIQLSHISQMSNTCGINPFVFILRSTSAVMKSCALVMNACFSTKPRGFLIILPMYDSFLLSIIYTYIYINLPIFLKLSMNFDTMLYFQMAKVRLYRWVSAK